MTLKKFWIEKQGLRILFSTGSTWAPIMIGLSSYLPHGTCRRKVGPDAIDDYCRQDSGPNPYYRHIGCSSTTFSAQLTVCHRDLKRHFKTDPTVL